MSTFYIIRQRQIEINQSTDELIKKTAMTEALRLMEQDEAEVDQWMQPSQPLPESGYSSNASSDQEQGTNDNNNSETKT